MVAKGGDFVVKEVRKEVVAAVLPMQEHWLPLSNLDLLLPAVDVGVFFCYKKPPTSIPGGFCFGSMASALKKALAQALVTYYAFAGELVENSAGEPELLCNNGGVDFVEASADVELRNLNFYRPHESVEGKLVPKKKNGVLAVQVTELKCGGLVVACTFDHRVADAYSANMFFVSWAVMAQSKPLSQLPLFRRSLFIPRHPGHYDNIVNDTYVPISTISNTKDPELGGVVDQQLISRVYYINANQLHLLQCLTTGEHVGCANKKTKVEALSAFLWKLLATDASINKKKNCRLGIVVDGRTRLSSGDAEKGKSMAAYFGNVLSIPFGEKKVEELNARPLTWAADSIHEFLNSTATKEHFLGMIDWVEAHRPEPAVAKIYTGRHSEEGPALVVSSGLRFPVAKVDFGWGKPVFGSYHFPWGGEAGYVMPMPSPLENGDWVVYMLLLQSQMELIETKASHLFKPLTPDYLKLI